MNLGEVHAIMQKKRARKLHCIKEQLRTLFGSLACACEGGSHGPDCFSINERMALYSQVVGFLDAAAASGDPEDFAAAEEADPAQRMIAHTFFTAMVGLGLAPDGARQYVLEQMLRKVALAAGANVHTIKQGMN